MPPARQRWRAPSVAARNSSADREPHPGRDLLGAQEIFVRGMLEVLAFERDQALVAAVSGPWSMVMARWPWPSSAPGSAAPAAMAAATRAASKRAQARTLPGVRVIDHQHPHRPVGLGLQDEAAFELQRRAEQHGQHDGLAQQLGHRDGIVVPRQDGVDRRDRSRTTRPRRSSASTSNGRMVSSAEVAAGARIGISSWGWGSDMIG